MGRFRKGRIGKQKKKRLVPVTVHETRMGKEQHTAYVQLLEDVLGTQAGNRQSHSRAPPPRIMSLSSLRHPGRKIAKINKNLTEAFNAANNAVFKNHGIHPGDPLLQPTTLELPSTVHDKFRVIVQRILHDQPDLPECVLNPDLVDGPVVATEILFKLIKAMDVHGLSAAKVNEIRQILPRTALPSSDKIRGGIAALNQTIIESLGLYSDATYATVDVTKTITWLIQSGLIPDERRIGLLFSGDGRSTGASAPWGSS